MSDRPATLCILVATPPLHGNTRTLFKISEAALGLGHLVRIFLIGDGVYHILCPEFSALIEAGAEVTLCAHNAMERGIAKQPNVNFGSQYDFSGMVARSDAFLSLH